MTPKKAFYKVQAESVIKKLEQRNMEGFYCETSEEALKKTLSLMEPNSIISWGGSQTINEIGLLSELSHQPYTLLDRSTATSADETRDIYLKAFNADYYLMSTNAITLDGELINIDGTGNRTAALIYGPKNVIVIAGMNKVVTDQNSGIDRVRNFASPPNAIRIAHTQTPCSKTGKCHDCISEECICCHTVITRFSRIPKRIKVILVGETLGY